MGFVYVSIFCALLLQGCKWTEAISDFNIESCPKDSTFVFDTCKCDHSLCQKPQCLTSLVVLSNATDTPGSCCPTYSCEGCQEADKINGQCPCATNAILDSPKGECKCVNPHETLKNITCECDSSKCKLPDLCVDGVPVRHFDGCCEIVTCLDCPYDSYPTKFPDFEIENNCVCYPCNTKCEPHQQIKIIHKGRNLPGHCCDIFECQDSDGPKGCVEGETIDSCKCLNGILMCSHVDDDSDFSTCLEEKNVYHHLQTWMRDACTNCTCINGETKCIAHMCDVVTKEVKMVNYECPQVGPCKRSCKNGYKLDKMGCETCKCKLPTDKVYVKSDQYLQLESLFKEYNLTESDAVALLKSALLDKSDRTVKSSTTKAALVVPSTSYCITSGQNSYENCSYNCILEYAMPGFLIGVMIAGLVSCLLIKLTEKKRQKYEMTEYRYKPVGKEVHEKGLNFPSIIKAKTLELQSYNEKKNVI